MLFDARWALTRSLGAPRGPKIIFFPHIFVETPHLSHIQSKKQKLEPFWISQKINIGPAYCGVGNNSDG